MRKNQWESWGVVVNSGKWASGGHDFSIILQVGPRVGLGATPLVRESMQLMPIIGGQQRLLVGVGGSPAATCGSGRRPGASADC